MTPTNGPGRLSEIATKAKGFVYCQARKGTTGRKTEIDDDTLQFIDQCKAATDERVPLGLGFGIATGEDVMALRGKVAVAIVGTALLRAWQDQGENGFREILQRLNDARR
jgi:tryptophan synthase alpha chain